MIVAPLLPILDRPETPFLASYLAMREHTLEQRPDIKFQGHIKHRCVRIEEAREALAELALQGGADWLFWLDDDQTFPSDVLIRLLAHDLPLVGANYRKRFADRVESAARRRANGTFEGIEPKREGIEAVDILGFGVTLIRADVFRKLPRPWFKWGPVCEDGYFCEQAIRYGYQPHVDHALSREVGHIAETVLKF